MSESKEEKSVDFTNMTDEEVRAWINENAIGSTHIKAAAYTGITQIKKAHELSKTSEKKNNEQER